MCPVLWWDSHLVPEHLLCCLVTRELVSEELNLLDGRLKFCYCENYADIQLKFLYSIFISHSLFSIHCLFMVLWFAKNLQLFGIGSHYDPQKEIAVGIALCGCTIVSLYGFAIFLMPITKYYLGMSWRRQW